MKRLGITQELLSLVTGLAHYLKILIRLTLNAALSLVIKPLFEFSKVKKKKIVSYMLIVVGNDDGQISCHSSFIGSIDGNTRQGETQSR